MRSIGYTHEHNDCTVRALSVAANIPYEQCHEAFKHYGRKDKHGLTNIKKIFPKVCHRLGLKSRQVARSGTINKLVKKYPTGRIYCTMRGHAFCIVDGVPHDVKSKNCRIKTAWIITDEKRGADE